MLRGPILFITGAGASVDSGLRTYRGKGGIYEGGGNPANDLHITTWRNDPLRTWNTLKPLVKAVRENKPGPTYELMKEIAKEHEIMIFTQNVDGYSKTVCDRVWEMHGNLETMECEECGKVYKLDEDDHICKKCNVRCKPNIVFYGEDIKHSPLMYYSGKSDFKTVIVIGTTLQFPYLERMIDKYKSGGALVIHINPDDKYPFTKHIWMKMKSERALKLLK